jgi:hypothetical protein
MSMVVTKWLKWLRTSAVETVKENLEFYVSSGFYETHSQ